MRDCYKSFIKCKDTSTVEIYVSVTKQEYKYCCRISESDSIQHNGQGEVQIDEYEENSM